ncbi:MAG TPA: dTDP-4-dehydrorhamnose 3,5-epimerase [Desulfitobacterium dehalogenans]|uniref:dTDP-4-dehydrorhamnose 3,5-epimerase n=1 Tax=Desulfitobacterium dehalogenans TaxID=36854 RepID=A0A7C6Z451_9FIRM|nr:dTDP-4-dehydrorhamnose 3,5-epimerase [Desulfitobacterium dehalogenans]
MIENIIETAIPGCFVIKLKDFTDNRGQFIKTFNIEEFINKNLETDFKEEYYSVSGKHVLRGMHFQRKPYDHTKIIFCLSGEVQDVVVDIRQNSPTFGQYVSFDLKAHDGQLIYMPKGTAHGFLSLAADSVLMYKVSSVYAPEYDSGILWNSCGIAWKVTEGLIISERDNKFATLAEMNGHE